MSTTFDGYEPLDKSKRQIRLLTICPSTAFDDADPVVTCTLETVELQDANPFYALSYVWGPPAPTNPVSINGQIIHVRRSLWVFLHALRARFCHKTKSKALVYSSIRVWADYVCIEQSNTQERSYQVSMMGDIYKTANAIYAWLGESLDKEGMECVAETVAMRERNVPWIQILKQVGDIEAKTKIIASSPYWTRMWIKQEALLAKDLWFFSGADLAHWQDISFVAKLCPKEGIDQGIRSRARHMPVANADDMLALLEFRDRHLVQFELSVLIQKFADARCQDTRDRIYALLALIDEDTRKQVVVDYEKPVFQVLLENYVHWAQFDAIAPRTITGGSDYSMHHLGQFCANVNKILPKMDFELLCRSEGVRREITDRKAFAGTNVSSIVWTCVIASIGVRNLDPISLVQEVESEGTAFVLMLGLRPYRSRATARSRQCLVYADVVPCAKTLVVWIGSRVLFLNSPDGFTESRVQALADTYVVGSGTEIREIAFNKSRNDHLCTKMYRHPSIWLTEQFPDARYEIGRTQNRLLSENIPIMCNAAAILSLLRESRRSLKWSPQIDGDRDLSQSNKGSESAAEERSVLWSLYGFGLDNKLLQPCRACRTGALTPRWQETISSACECRWIHRMDS